MVSPPLQKISNSNGGAPRSTAIATNSVVEGRDEDVAYAVTVVTVFGTLSMVLYPLVAVVLQLSPESFGIWSGASIHEVA